MAKAHSVQHSRSRFSCAKRMSTHIAYALVVYTLLLIFIVSPALETTGMAISNAAGNRWMPMALANWKAN